MHETVEIKSKHAVPRRSVVWEEENGTLSDEDMIANDRLNIQEFHVLSLKHNICFSFWEIATKIEFARIGILTFNPIHQVCGDGHG